MVQDHVEVNEIMGKIPTKKRSNYYDGKFYACMMEPRSSALHKLAAETIPEDSTVVDICCGTGAFTRMLAPKCSKVLGVDLSPRMIQYANSERDKLGLENIQYQLGNASQLADIPDDAFDFATAFMALHEMPHEERTEVLPEMKRIASRVLVVDFLPSLPWNFEGLRYRWMEIVAGPNHFAGFRDFRKRGGLPPLIEAAGFSILRQGVIDKGNLAIYTLGKKGI